MIKEFFTPSWPKIWIFLAVIFAMFLIFGLSNVFFPNKILAYFLFPGDASLQLLVGWATDIGSEITTLIQLQLITVSLTIIYGITFVINIFYFYTISCLVVYICKKCKKSKVRPKKKIKRK
jgi:hypothetical protein